MILVNVTIWIWRFYSSRCYHDEVIKWKHFPRYWPFVRGNHRPPVNDVTEMRASVGTKATLWSCSLCMNTVKGSNLLGQDCDHLLRCAYRLQISWLHLDLLERLYDINQFNPRCVKQIFFRLVQNVTTPGWTCLCRWFEKSCLLDTGKRCRSTTMVLVTAPKMFSHIEVRTKTRNSLSCFNLRSSHSGYKTTTCIQLTPIISAQRAVLYPAKKYEALIYPRNIKVNSYHLPCLNQYTFSIFHCNIYYAAQDFTSEYSIWIHQFSDRTKTYVV